MFSRLRIVTIIFGLLGLTGAGVAIERYSTSTPNLEPESVVEFTSPWIEVVSSKITELDNSEKELRELATGDEVSVGDYVVAGKGASANLHFPDGSVLRIDSETKILVEAASYDENNDKLIVKIKLTAGRVWSRVLSFVTPESVWEVKTSNAVATVRGTAFGMEFVNGKSSVVGSENVVAVKAISETNSVSAPAAKNNSAISESKEESEVVVTSDTFVEIGGVASAPAVSESKSGVMKLTPKKITREILAKAWVKANKTEDGKFNEKLKKFESEIKDAKEARKAFREDVRKEFKKRIEERRKEMKKNIEDRILKNGVEDVKNIKKDVLPDIKTESRNNAGGGSVIKALKLKIAPETAQKKMKEGETLQFKATLEMADGSVKDVTRETKWQVLGGIGTISASGLFTAKLSLDVAEFGVGKGAVVAEFTEGGAPFLGKTEVFTVEASFDVPIGIDG